MPRWWCATLLSFVSALSHAQPSDLVRRGAALRAEHEDARALELFEQAYREDPRPSTLAEIGLAEQALGRWADAYDHLREALQSDDAWITSQRPTLDEAFTVISEHVGWVEVLCSAEGAYLTLDGRDATLNDRVTVRAGRIVATVEAQGNLPVERELDVAPGAHLRETVRLTAIPIEPPAHPVNSPIPVSSIGPALTIAGAATIVLAAIGAGASIATGMSALSAQDRLRSECRPTVCPGDLRSVQADAAAYSLATDVLWISAASTAAIGITLLVWGVMEGGL